MLRDFGNKIGSWAKGFIEPGTLVSLFAAIFTLGVFIATIFIVLDTRKATERQIRAYVHATFEKNADIRGVNNGMGGVITIAMKGETPAYEVQTRGRIALLNSGSKSWEFLETYAGTDFGPMYRQTLFGDNDKITVPAEIPSYTLDATRLVRKNVIDQLGKHANSLYVWGTVTYKDAFECRRFVDFCYHVEGRDGEGRIQAVECAPHGKNSDNPAECVKQN